MSEDQVSRTRAAVVEDHLLQRLRTIELLESNTFDVVASDPRRPKLGVQEERALVLYADLR